MCRRNIIQFTYNLLRMQANDVRDVMVDFTGGTPGKTVISDFAFVQDENLSLIHI